MVENPVISTADRVNGGAMHFSTRNREGSLHETIRRDRITTVNLGRDYLPMLKHDVTKPIWKIAISMALAGAMAVIASAHAYAAPPEGGKSPLRSGKIAQNSCRH